VSERDEGEPRTELARLYQEMAVAGASATLGEMYGPAATIAGAVATPLVLHAAKRLREFFERLSNAGVVADEIEARLAEDEALAQVVAEAIRGTVEAELEAKRRLLARAAIHALKDDSAVDVEAVFVRSANALDTIDIYVLSLVAELQRLAPGKLVQPQQVIEKWPGTAAAIDGAFAALTAAGVVRGPGTQLGASGAEVTMTAHGEAFLDRLLKEGLEDELARRRS